MRLAVHPAWYPDRTIYFEDTDGSASRVVRALMDLEKAVPGKPIKLVINSDGGSTQDIFAVVDVMRTITSPVHTIGLGRVCGLAAVVLAAGKKGHREVYKSTRLMIHELRLAGGDAGGGAGSDDLPPAKRPRMPEPAIADRMMKRADAYVAEQLQTRQVENRAFAAVHKEELQQAYDTLRAVDRENNARDAIRVVFEQILARGGGSVRQRLRENKIASGAVVPDAKQGDLPQSDRKRTREDFCSKKQANALRRVDVLEAEASLLRRRCDEDRRDLAAARKTGASRVQDVKDTPEEMLKLNQMMLDMIAKFTGRKCAASVTLEIAGAGDNHLKFSAEEAVTYGLADSVTGWG